MAITINRAPFNALVDDSGQNLDGSIWNKAAIQGVVLDPVDVALAQLSAQGTWTPVIAGSSGGGATYAIQQGQYLKIGNLVLLQFDTALSSKGTIAGGIQISGVPFPVAMNAAGPVAYVSGLATPWASVALLGLSVGLSVFGLPPAGGLVVSQLQATDLTNNARIVGSVTYITS